VTSCFRRSTGPAGGKPSSSATRPTPATPTPFESSSWNEQNRSAERPFPFEAPFHPAEVAHEVFQAWLTFALFDNARRGARGTDPERYRRELGEQWHRFTEVAARNPQAWFPLERSAAEIIDATPTNRMVASPYTKYMVSIMDVDMAGALVLTSHEAADALGVPADRRVYLRGWCYATDPEGNILELQTWSA